MFKHYVIWLLKNKKLFVETEVVLSKGWEMTEARPSAPRSFFPQLAIAQAYAVEMELWL
jgi:hypothetical protein